MSFLKVGQKYINKQLIKSMFVFPIRKVSFPGYNTRKVRYVVRMDGVPVSCTEKEFEDEDGAHRWIRNNFEIQETKD